MESKTLYSNLLILQIGTGKLLFLKRADTCELEPRKWCFPGGHMESYESPDEGALREALEETGLDFKDFTPIKIGMHTNSRAIMYYYMVAVDDFTKYGVLHLDMSEHQQYTWRTPKQAINELELMLDLGDQMQAMFFGVQQMKQ
jgi:8-oxo-dGTP pyrophosphatase MutT (NUDIX family)